MAGNCGKTSADGESFSAATQLLADSVPFGHTLGRMAAVLPQTLQKPLLSSLTGEASYCA